MKATLSETKSTERLLEIEIPRARLDKIFQDKVKKYSKEIRINGFRQGAVPKEVIAKRFKDPLDRESMEALLDEVIKEACKEHKIEPVAPGRIDKLENEGDKPIFVKALLEVDPVLDLKDYQHNVPVNIQAAPESEIEKQLLTVQKRLAEEKRVERAAQKGDVVVAEYRSIVVDGQVQALPQNRDFRLEIGSQGIEELDAGLLGCKSGEEKILDFTFPATYGNAALAGKKGEYKLYVLEINELSLPILNDAFAIKAGFDSLEAFKTRIRADLDKQALEQAKEVAYEEALKKLIEANPFDVPKARIQSYVNYQLEQQGHHHSPGEEHGHDHSDLEKEAEFNIKRFRILDEISKKENIKPSQEDVDARITEMAEYYGTDFETLKASLRKNGKIIDIREELKSQKTLDFVIGYKG